MYKSVQIFAAIYGQHRFSKERTANNIMVVSMFGFSVMMESAFDWVELQLIKHSQASEKRKKRREHKMLKQGGTISQTPLFTNKIKE